MLRYRLFMGNNHTSQALPCLNTKQSAAKSIAKGQHALGAVDISSILFKQAPPNRANKNPPKKTYLNRRYVHAY